MAELQEFKCPCCGGAIGFDSTIQKMKCPYCDTEFDIETLISYDRELKNERPEDLTWETQAGGGGRRGRLTVSVLISATPAAEKSLRMRIRRLPLVRTATVRW